MPGEQIQAETVGNQLLSLWEGLDREALEALADAKGHNARVELERIESDSSHMQDRLAAFEASVTQLLRTFSIDPADWQSKALLLKRDNRYPVVQYKEDIQKYDSSQSLGKLLFNLASHNLLIEDEEDGYGYTELVLALSLNLQVRLIGEGQHWSGRHYRDPVSGEILTDGWHDRRIEALQETIGDHELDKLLVDYEVAFMIDFKAEFGRPGTENSVG